LRKVELSSDNDEEDCTNMTAPPLPTLPVCRSMATLLAPTPMLKFLKVMPDTDTNEWLERVRKRVLGSVLDTRTEPAAEEGEADRVKLEGQLPALAHRAVLVGPEYSPE
jgi:hypothetical protein